jgi:TonB family protein
MSDRTCFILSLVLHISLFMYFCISPKPKSPKTPFIPVTLAMEVIEEPKPEPPKVEKQEKKKPEENTITHVRTPRPTAVSQKPTPKPTATPTPKKKLSKETLDKLKDLLNKTPTPRPKPTNAPTVKPTQAPSATPTPLGPEIPLDQINNPKVANAVSSASDMSFTLDIGNSNVDFNPYAATLANILKRNWRTPTVRHPEPKDYSAYVSFSISRNGTISHIKLENESGWLLMDNSVLEAIQRSSPLPPLPAAYTSNDIRVRFPFQLPYK